MSYKRSQDWLKQAPKNWEWGKASLQGGFYSQAEQALEFASDFLSAANATLTDESS